jgi:hypothetical protein
MKRILLALLLALSVPFAQAATPATAPTDVQIDRLLEVMRARQTLEAMLPQVEASQREMVGKMIAGLTMTDTQRLMLERIMDRNAENLRSTLTWQKLEPMYRDIYRQTFEAGDMDAMIDFYGSAPGQRVLDKMPQLMQHTMSAMQTLLVPMMERMQKDVAAELDASRTPPPAAE